MLHLLFADNGWLTAAGSFYWRKLLFWLFCLELLQIPISWQKVREGPRVQWVGYQLDAGCFTKGISSKKVNWMMEWMDKHGSAGGITGRDLTSALGRFGFVAGALQHVRPFLGPFFAWSAVLAPGTFASFPAAVNIFLQEVKEEPMTRPCQMRGFSRKAFRVDAKLNRTR